MNFIGGYPTGFFVSTFVSQPVDQVLELAFSPLVNLGVEDFRYLEFLFSVDLNGRQRSLRAVRNWVRSGWLEHGDVEYGVNCMEGVREFEGIGLQTWLSDNLEGSLIPGRQLA